MALALACSYPTTYLGPHRTRVERRVRQSLVRVLAREGVEGVSKDTWNMVSLG
jgi:hypothetical protein